MRASSSSRFLNLLGYAPFSNALFWQAGSTHGILAHLTAWLYYDTRPKDEYYSTGDRTLLCALMDDSTPS